MVDTSDDQDFPFFANNNFLNQTPYGSSPVSAVDQNMVPPPNKQHPVTGVAQSSFLGRRGHSLGS